MPEQPLWYRLYFEPAYTEVARVVGYAGLDAKEARTKIESLFSKYSKERVERASESLLQWNDVWVRLTTQARGMCAQLLGRPPEAPPQLSAREMVGEAAKAEPVKEKPKRKPKGTKAMENMPGTLGKPIMEQWKEAKEQHPGMILLFKIGDFYEAFHDDAKKLAQVCKLTLTSRDRETEMAGFPFQALQPRLKELLNAGHRVAICEQVESKKKREVTRVVTPGSIVEQPR